MLPYSGMENRKAISLKLPPDLLKDLDTYCSNQQPYNPTRTQVIEEAIRVILGKTKRKDRS